MENVRVNVHDFWAKFDYEVFKRTAHHSVKVDVFLDLNIVTFIIDVKRVRSKKRMFLTSRIKANFISIENTAIDERRIANTFRICKAVY